MKIRIVKLLLSALLLVAGTGIAEAGMNQIREVEDAIAIIQGIFKNSRKSRFRHPF